jgi:hypothetical protein
MRNIAAISMIVLCAACGSSGPQGERGVQGTQGDKGAVGATGATGAMGVGEPGQTGAQGFTGPQGDTGAAGPQGPNGIAGAPGQNGASSPGFIWRDSNNQAMPFFQVTDQNLTVDGVAGMVVDPNTGHIWAFTYSPTAGFVASVAEPNALAASPTTSYFLTPNCYGTEYYQWDFNKDVTVGNTSNSYTEVARSEAVVLTMLSIKPLSTGICVSQYNTPITSTFIEGVQLESNPHPPGTIGAPPYSLTWQD